MFIDYTDEQKALRAQLRTYFAGLFTPALQAELDVGFEGGGPEFRRALRQMGSDGWLGLGWPKEVGGQGRGAVEQFIFFDEVQRAGFPIPILTLCTVGPTLVKFGTDEQRARFLPGILAGDLHFSIGYTEPEAGTDLASLKTRAVKDGDDWVITGQKVYTSLATEADYIWMAARTDPDAPKHKGITIFVLDAKAPGVSMAPMETLGDNPVCTTFYDAVRVPEQNIIGGLNKGWKLITTQLNHERVALMSVGPLERTLDESTAWARETRDAAGAAVIERPWVREHLARVYAKLEVLRLMNWKQAFSIASDTLSMADASTVKVFGSEFYVEAYRLLLEVLGPAGAMKVGSSGAALRGRVERFYRATLVLTFGGGTNEVQRDLIAMSGLGIPRGPY